MDVPEHLTDYPCREYFADELAVHGFWDDSAQLWVIVPAAEVEELRDGEGQLGFLAIGRAGVGGISFGYRKGMEGFWAYHPVDRDFQFLASDIRAFLTEWRDGTIRV